MAVIMKRLLLYWVIATVYCLYTAEPYDPELGLMGVIQSEQMYGILAQAFYYAAIVMAVQRLYERSKENKARIQKEQEKADAEAALASPAFSQPDDDVEDGDEDDDADGDYENDDHDVDAAGDEDGTPEPEGAAAEGRRE
ncbi:MAG: hypothetical protein LIQ31_00720 [Planctomycetes bacterium]|nr:hypothetical protein [Planctomycetota bacterium]